MKKTISIVLATMLILAVFAPAVMAAPTNGIVVDGVTYTSEADLKEVFRFESGKIKDGSVIEVYGKVSIPHHNHAETNNVYMISHDGQPGQVWAYTWIISQKNVTVVGKTADATLYSKDFSTSGNHGEQSFIYVAGNGDNATFKDLTIMPIMNTYYGAGDGYVNKTIEVLAKNFTMTGCKMVPNTLADPSAADDCVGGSLYFNGPKENVTVENNYFEEVALTFDGVSSTASVAISDNEFDKPRPGGFSIIGNTSWAPIPVTEMGNVIIEGNTFKNMPEDYPNIIKNVMNGEMILVDNIVDYDGDGTADGSILDHITIAPHSAIAGDDIGSVKAIIIEGDTVIELAASEEGGVKPPVELPSGIALDKSIAFMKKAQTLTLTATKLSELDIKAVVWTTSDSAVLSVNAGKVTAVGDGIATITATIAGTSLSARCEILVGNIVLNKSEAYAQKGAALNLNVANLGSLNVNVEWSTSNAAVATVSNGVVTAVSNGEAIITATVAGTDLSASCKVIVTGISLDKDMYSMSINMRVELFASLEYGTAPIVWSSSNKNIALVDQNGVVTAIRQGETTITATIEGTTISDSCTIYVGQAEKTQSIIDGILEFFRMIFAFLGNLFTGR